MQFTIHGGVAVAKYVYDAWGNHKIYDANNNEVTSTTHIGYINPIRYRGYYFDVETGLYYLQARYYDPETGRFLNSDAIEYLAPEQLGGLNLYAYCNNNPVMDADPTGCFGILTAILIGAVIGAVIGATIEGVEAYEEAVEEGATGLELVGKTIAGAAKGAVIGGALGAVAGAASYGVASAIVAGATALTTGTGAAGALALANGGVLASGETVAVAASALLLGIGIVFSKPNSGRIRFSDDTGINPETGKPFDNAEEARRYYKRIKDAKAKLKWKKWLKGKGWYQNHLD